MFSKYHMPSALDYGLYENIFGALHFDVMHVVPVEMYNMHDVRMKCAKYVLIQALGLKSYGIWKTFIFKVLHHRSPGPIIYV